MIIILEKIDIPIESEELHEPSQIIPIERKSDTPQHSRNPKHPVCFYYWINKWRAKKIIIDNLIYHRIGKFIYLSDGRLYMGTYNKNQPNDIDTMAMDPDEITYSLCPCFLTKQIKYIDSLEQ